MDTKQKAIKALQSVSWQRAIEIVTTVGIRVYRPIYEKMIEAGISHEDAMNVITDRLRKNLS